jgi:hypothetical protein
MDRRDLLRACDGLRAAGCFGSYVAGDLVARGFADVGYEEFLVLHGGRVMSRLTGQISEVTERERAMLFVVPDCDRVVREVGAAGVDVRECHRYPDGGWRVAGEGEHGPVSAEGVSLLAALVQLLATTVQVTMVPHGSRPTLRTG